MLESTSMASALSQLLAAALAELRPKFAAISIRAIALDFHPWHPVLELSVLTVQEWAADPALLDEREQAAWAGFHVTDAKRDGAGLSAHPVALALHTRYRERAGDVAFKAAMFELARAALSSEPVRRELERWSTHRELALYASDPDAA